MAEPKKKEKPGINPGVESGDEVFFHHDQHGALSGKVLAHGKHGATIEAKGEHHRVKWDSVRGHKKRAEMKAKIVEHGDDGAILEMGDGSRRFVNGNFGNMDQVMNESMAKALEGKQIVFLKSHVTGYARKDGSYVADHEDSRTKKEEKKPGKDWRDEENWHSRQMGKMKTLSEPELRYIVKDATEAAEIAEKTNPHSAKAGQYRDEAHYASMELYKRRQASQKGESVLAKSHVKAYTRKDGVQVQEHDDKRQAARPEMSSGKRSNVKDDESRGAAKGYGTHDIQPGSKVKFQAGEHKGSGEVTAVGKHGVTVKDGGGREHGIEHHEITRHEAGEGVKKPEIKNEVLGEQKPIPAESFTAADYAKSHDLADVTEESILSHFPEDTKDRIKAANDRLKGIEQTIDKFKKEGRWSAERKVLHSKIISEILSPERRKAASPEAGKKPTFTILGGRGGSGKSAFEGTVYDPNKAIVLDADHIKGLLPEYSGWNAHQVHEESGELFDEITDLAQAFGLNIVHDATMKTGSKAVALIERFNDAGYDTEAHYMHLPRQEAAKRAVGRFLGGGEKGRYVPIEVVLGNTKNEQSFDMVKGIVKKWSFRDNNVAKGEKPILISESGEKPTGEEKPQESEKTMAKSLFGWLGSAKIYLWRK